MIAATFIIATYPAHSGKASRPPFDLCLLLPAAEASKIVGQACDSPQESIARALFPKGTKRRYRPQDGNPILFIAYVDPSRSVAVHRFAKGTAFFRGEKGAEQMKGIADEAYWDGPTCSLFARAGFASLSPLLSADGTANPADNSSKEKQLLGLTRPLARRMESSSSGKRAQESSINTHLFKKGA